jgi:hypothetical protein
MAQRNKTLMTATNDQGEGKMPCKKGRIEPLQVSAETTAMFQSPCTPFMHSFKFSCSLFWLLVFGLLIIEVAIASGIRYKGSYNNST